jgi:hypothetical protein
MNNIRVTKSKVEREMGFMRKPPAIFARSARAQHARADAINTY